MKQVKEAIKAARKSLINLNTGIESDKQYNINIDTKSPIYEAVKLTPISELDYII